MNRARLGAVQARQMFYRLLVVTGSGLQDGRLLADGLGMPRIRIGEELGQELLDVPARSRPLEVAVRLEGLVRGVAGDGVLLDRIEILFEESLSVEPLTLLKDLSRRRLIVVVWSGGIEAGNLVYGVPGHPEYRSYPAQDVTLARFI